MNPLKLAAWALLAVVATEMPAQAAWNNVFQPTFFGRWGRQSTSNSSCVACVPIVARAAPVCNSCPQPTTAFFQPTPVVVAPAPACNTCQSPPPAPTQQCTTNYIQRSFYEPVTTYESRSFYEPVTTMQTSFYWEPVTTMQTSFYPDPCNCGLIAKSCPVTSYQLRQQSNPVQTWVQRCAQVPVQSFRLSYKLEPQTTCCTTTPGTGAPPTAPPMNSNPAPSYSPPPVIDTPRQAPSGPNVGTNTNTQGSYSPGAMTTNQPKAPAWQPAVNLGPITPEAGDLVQGQVVRNDRSPTANAQVLFVNADTGTRHSITTNDAGRFNLALATGNYHVFLTSGSGATAYHSQVNVDRNRANVVNLINN